jgi:hypothetical protein
MTSAALGHHALPTPDKFMPATPMDTSLGAQTAHPEKKNSILRHDLSAMFSLNPPVVNL